MTGDNSQSEQLHQEKAQSVYALKSGKTAQTKQDMKIPKIIQDIADKHGLNSVSYIGKRRGKDAFMMGFIDENGEALATGLPTIYLTDGKTVEVVSGMDGLELL